MAVAVCLGVDGQVRSGRTFEMTVDAVGGVYIIQRRGASTSINKQSDVMDGGIWG